MMEHNLTNLRNSTYNSDQSWAESVVFQQKVLKMKLHKFVFRVRMFFFGFMVLNLFLTGIRLTLPTFIDNNFDKTITYI